MQHFSCDSCGKELGPTGTVRYTLRLEARLALESIDSTDESPDPVDDMEDWLAGSSDETLDDTDPTLLPLTPLDKTYDLCAGCCARVHADPLGVNRTRRFQFGNN